MGKFGESTSHTPALFRHDHCPPPPPLTLSSSVHISKERAQCKKKEKCEADSHKRRLPCNMPRVSVRHTRKRRGGGGRSGLSRENDSEKNDTNNKRILACRTKKINDRVLLLPHGIVAPSPLSLLHVLAELVLGRSAAHA